MSLFPSFEYSIQRYIFISRRKSAFKARRQKLERRLATSQDTRVTTVISIGFIILKRRRFPDIGILSSRSKNRVFHTMIIERLLLVVKPLIHLPPREVLVRLLSLLARFNNQFIYRHWIHVQKKLKTKKILSLQH